MQRTNVWNKLLEEDLIVLIKPNRKKKKKKDNMTFRKCQLLPKKVFKRTKYLQHDLDNISKIFNVTAGSRT